MPIILPLDYSFKHFSPPLPIIDVHELFRDFHFSDRVDRYFPGKGHDGPDVRLAPPTSPIRLRKERNSMTTSTQLHAALARKSKDHRLDTYCSGGAALLKNGV
jgi:hypothetical protein